MREKIKGKIKKILPIMFCIMLIFGSCISVNAAKVNSNILLSNRAQSLNWTSIWKLSEDKYLNLRIDVELVSGDNVYLIPFESRFLGSKSLMFFAVSDSPYTLQYYTNVFNSSDYRELTSINSSEIVNSTSGSTLTINGKNFYYSEIGASSDINYTLMNSNLPVYDFYSKYGDNSKNSYQNFISDNFDSGFTWDDGHGGGGGSFAEYEDTPTGSIDPPKNLSIYRGYSTSDRQYKFQLQWDKPEDLELYTEITAQIHYKNGSEHVYSNYVIEGRDGWSAQDNKYIYYENDLINDFFEYKEIDKPSVYNIEKLYVRFCKLVDGKFQYSLWRMVDYINLDSGNGYDAGEDDYIADSITGSFDENGNWKDQSVNNGEIVDGAEKENAKSPGLDVDGNNVAPPSKDTLNPDTWGIDFASVFQKFLEAMKEAISFIGEFPKAISEFFGFLPPYVIGCVIIGILAAILLRILGR